MSQPNQGLVQSIHTRLLNHAKETKQDFNRILERYGLERFLYRLSKSEYADQFVLKGALMMIVWLGDTARPTRDADLLGFGELGDETLVRIFKDLCTIETEPDGVAYDPDSVTIEDIREDNAYGGRRIRLRGNLGNARLTLQVDVGIGDAVTPEPETLEYPSLLDMPTAKLKAYHPETAIAEKLQIIVSFGMANTRMKDFFDIATLAQNESFNGARISEAISATFERRGTAIPEEPPIALTQELYKDAGKAKQWEAFKRKNDLEETGDLQETVEKIISFLWPVIEGIRAGGAIEKRWDPERGWH